MGGSTGRIFGFGWGLLWGCGMRFYVPFREDTRGLGFVARGSWHCWGRGRPQGSPLRDGVARRRGSGRLASRPYQMHPLLYPNHPHLNLPPSRGKRLRGEEDRSAPPDSSSRSLLRMTGVGWLGFFGVLGFYAGEDVADFGQEFVGYGGGGGQCGGGRGGFYAAFEHQLTLP